MASRLPEIESLSDCRLFDPFLFPSLFRSSGLAVEPKNDDDPNAVKQSSDSIFDLAESAGAAASGENESDALVRRTITSNSASTNGVFDPSSLPASSPDKEEEQPTTSIVDKNAIASASSLKRKRNVSLPSESHKKKPIHNLNKKPPVPPAAPTKKRKRIRIRIHIPSSPDTKRQTIYEENVSSNSNNNVNDNQSNNAKPPTMDEDQDSQDSTIDSSLNDVQTKKPRKVSIDSTADVESDFTVPSDGPILAPVPTSTATNNKIDCNVPLAERTTNERKNYKRRQKLVKAKKTKAKKSSDNDVDPILLPPSYSGSDDKNTKAKKSSDNTDGLPNNSRISETDVVGDPTTTHCCKVVTSRPTCNHEGCTSYVQRLGLCCKHLPASEKPKRAACNHEGCTSSVYKFGLFCKHLSASEKPKKPTCNHEGCTTRVHKFGLCQKHLPASEKPKRPTCNHEGCTTRVHKFGLCQKHLPASEKSKKPTCNHEGCTTRVYKFGLCQKHLPASSKEEDERRRERNRLLEDFGLVKKKPKQAKKRKTIKDDESGFWPGLTPTGISQCSQEPKAPRATISSAISSGGCETMTFLDTPEASMILSQHKGLKEQLEWCSTAKCLIADPQDPLCLKFQELINSILGNGKHFDHSLFRTHESYKIVGNLFGGMVPRSASVFRCNEDRNEHPNHKRIKQADGTLVFLGEHMDAHCMPTYFASLSTEDSFVYYTKDGTEISYLRIPAGLSVVYTTEINTGCKVLNEFELKHFSSSHKDRLLFRIVHQTGMKPFDLSQEGLVDKVIKSIEMIWKKKSLDRLPYLSSSMIDEEDDGRIRIGYDDGRIGYRFGFDKYSGK